MNRDKLIKIFMGLTIFLAVLFFSVGKWTYSGIAILAAMAIYMNLGGGNYNSRNLYEKKVTTSKEWSLESLYGELKDLETPLGKPWLGRNKAKEESCLVFGPTLFRNYILITVKGKDIQLISGTDTEHLEAPEEESWRFRNLLNTEHLEVTPKRYSAFAGDMVMTAVLMDDLASLLKEVDAGSVAVPESLDLYTLYHYNSSDLTVRDLEDNGYAKTSTAFDPLSIVIYDMDGQEVAKVTGDAGKRNQGFPVSISGEPYGTIYQDTTAKNDVYYLEGADGRFELRSFRAVRRANIGMNYIMTLNGEKKAVHASSPRIRFNSTGLIENDVICSYDDEYLLWYLILQELITSLNGFVK